MHVASGMTALAALAALVAMAACGGSPAPSGPAPAGQPPGTAPSYGSDRQVLEVVRAYDEAWRRRDTTGVARVLARQFVYLTSQGGVSTRDRHLAVAVAPEYRLDKDERSEVNIHREGATAVVSSRWRGQGTWQGRPFVDDQRCSLVLAHGPEGWRLLAEHCTGIPAPR